VPPTHSQPLGTAARSKRPFRYLTQHHETVTIPQTQSEHLLPRRCPSAGAVANKIRRRTFLNQSKRTFLLQSYRSRSRTLRSASGTTILQD